ncbi:MAG: DMT family transporter [Emergencia sp.]
MSNNNLKAEELYNKGKMRLAVMGLVLAFVSSLSLVIFQNFNVISTELINKSFPKGILSSYVLTLMTLSICEIIGAIIMICFNSFVVGIPLAEYGRITRVKSSRTVLLAAVVSGPVATACSMIGIGLCGSTYGNCIIGLTPILTAILGAIFLKEKTNARVFAGIAIAVVGVIIAGIAPPEGVKNFYLGLIITLIAPVGYSIEAIISTHAMDVSDPKIVCPLYRMLGGGILELLVAVVVCATTGNLEWISEIFLMVFTNKTLLIYILITAVFMCIQYNTIYSSYSYCGATRGSAILYTTPIWSIPIGLFMTGIGLIDFNITFMGIIGAVVIVAGIIVVLAKPSELFNLRDV